ncbi:4-alpha-glucanotransferase [Kribbella antibiotica]|uniref:4-alpha-glucanotransferase n=1 Tax=Kribbella antibiotica TaxID=190195 RepID=A0A4R4ZSP4_9ACTN|nr:4-alpha-glucanotransferase [Kribbella antibiotica]TDD60979.1 4-alpha-glucanotransferase [Kribbella antibiotica]
MTAPTPALVELAVAHGVATEYWNWQGEHVIVASEVVSTVLAALGVDASTPEKAAAALDDHQQARWRRTLPATVVMRAGWTPWFAVHLPHGSTAEVWVDLEDGGQRRDIPQQEHWVEPEWIDGVQIGEATYQLPGDLPLGYHRLCARIGSSPEISCGTLIVTPSKLEPEKLNRTWGWVLQLYSVRSRRSWGIGDLHDLADLAAWSANDLGAGFVLINPLHAAELAGRMEPSPYLPASRRFGNPIYLRIEDIDEYGDLAPAERDRVRTLSLQARALSEDANALDRDTVWAAKREALQLLFGVRPSIGRIAEYGAYCDREGQGLVDFATWAAISDVHGPEWSKWPEELRTPTSPAVTAFRNENPDAVEFHCWLQWQVDDQLARTQARAKTAGMSLGIVHDLAVGVHPDGADAWALQHVLAQGIHVGAPPDAFNQQGQDWSQPPWRPDALAETGYAAWRDLVRAVMRHGGGLRIDHILGMFRLWWVTSPERPTEGTYVRYDHEALIGILVLEATRAGVTVVGEDLGTVEPWVRDYLSERGVLGTSVLWFERGVDGKPLAPELWRELCLATVTTHDLPPTAGYLAGDHVELRNRLGLLTRPVAEELAVDEADRDAWLTALRERHLLRYTDGDVERIVEALHQYVAHTPSKLVGVALADAVGERRTQNQPGTTDEYPNWRVPLGGPDGEPVLVEDLPNNLRLRRLIGALTI